MRKFSCEAQECIDISAHFIYKTISKTLYTVEESKLQLTNGMYHLIQLSDNGFISVELSVVQPMTLYIIYSQSNYSTSL